MRSLVLNQRGIAALGMKPMNGHADAIKKGLLSAESAIARGFQPLSAAEMERIQSACAAAAGDGRFELYKVSLKFDNPQARRVHGFPDDRKETWVPVA